MDIGLILRIGGVGILVAALVVVLKQAGREEHGLMVTIVGVVVVLTLVMSVVADFFRTMRTIFNLY